MMQAPPPELPFATSALSRVIQSRNNLRETLKLDGANSAKPEGRLDQSESTLKSTLRLLKSPSSQHLFLNALQQLWEKNPWVILGQGVAQAANIVITPFAKQSPIKLVAIAFALGGVLFLARPWRFTSKRRLISRLLMR